MKIESVPESIDSGISQIFTIVSKKVQLNLFSSLPIELNSVWVP